MYYKTYLDYLLRASNKPITIFLNWISQMPRWALHGLFWMIISLGTFNQVYRMFSSASGPFNPLNQAHNPDGFWMFWPVHLLICMLFFYWLGYYIVPTYYSKKTPIQFIFWFFVYWLLSCYTMVILFETTAKLFPPAPPSIMIRIKAWEGRTWYDLLFDPAMFFFNWAFNFSYVIIPLLIKSQRDNWKAAEANLSLEKERMKMEMSFLKSQINPHFLFNAFNNLRQLIDGGHQQAGNVLDNISDLMRYSLYRTGAEYVSLKAELTFVTNYIELERIRFPESKTIKLSIKGKTGQFLIPPMVLICFIENSIKHGLNASVGPAYVDIQMAIDEHLSEFTLGVINSKSKDYRSKKEGGIGIVNVKKRLELLYGDRYTLELSDQGYRYVVFLRIPLKKSNDITAHQTKIDENLPEGAIIE